MRQTIAVLTMMTFVFATALAPVANAGIISTESYVQQVETDEQRTKIVDMLQREDVRERMVAMGVDPVDVEARLAGLSDAEVAQLATQMDELPAGAGVLEMLLAVVLIFVVLDIAGVTDVFPFIRSAD